MEQAVPQPLLNRRAARPIGRLRHRTLQRAAGVASPQTHQRGWGSCHPQHFAQRQVSRAGRAARSDEQKTRILQPRAFPSPPPTPTHHSHSHQREKDTADGHSRNTMCSLSPSPLSLHAAASQVIHKGLELLKEQCADSSCAPGAVGQNFKRAATFASLPPSGSPNTRPDRPATRRHQHGRRRRRRRVSGCGGRNGARGQHRARAAHLAGAGGQAGRRAAQRADGRLWAAAAVVSGDGAGGGGRGRPAGGRHGGRARGRPRHLLPALRPRAPSRDPPAPSTP